MLSVYLLVTIFTQFAPQNLWLLPENGPSEVIVELDKLNGIRSGSAVLVEGRLVGTVSDIRDLPATSSSTGLPATEGSSSIYALRLRIAPHHRKLLRRGTIALVKSPLSASRSRPETVLELLLPRSSSSPILEDGEFIAGYSSFQDFWSADLTKRGIDPQLFRLS